MSVKTKQIIGWVLTGVISLLFLFSAFMKFSSDAKAMEGMAAIGLTAVSVKVIGVVELLSLILFIIPRTGVLGTLLMAAYLGGAIATHLEHQAPVTMAVVVESVVWITAVIRFPELLKRITGKA